ncbi:GGDEF domain-containing protein [Neptunomonas antarctica]|uniref:diguanylate cyclase n=1 Tax=Neptunomonas antarctica TaxID=619304 RepID=A0A1N7KLE1_9GAMM|nr:GGDEF domain-containing protein [Neptunomonas antarctica]SIS62431.1 diguanylate cyclase [Neptunomonas antarctica]
MKFAENTTQSAEYLRQAIPLMVKYNIPPNPLNYALWYTYVSNRIPSLNFQIDQTLDTYGTCPTLLGEQMFREHVINDEIANSDQTQNQLIALTQNLHRQAAHAAKNTSDYGAMLDDSLTALNQNDSNHNIEKIINRLAENTLSISESTGLFQKQITDAQTEILALKAELQKTRQDARIDPLTGLYNRRVFNTELEQVAGASKHTNTALIMLDIDHFKKFNDDYGHLMGDKVLQYFGKLLKAECKEPALPVRFGGEEFAILMIGHNEEDAAIFAENLRQKIQAIRIKQKKSGKIISSITASFGISKRTENESAEQLIERADKALYLAKNSGRNQVKIAP